MARSSLLKCGCLPGRVNIHCRLHTRLAYRTGAHVGWFSFPEGLQTEWLGPEPSKFLRQRGLVPSYRLPWRQKCWKILRGDAVLYVSGLITALIVLSGVLAALG